MQLYKDPSRDDWDVLLARPAMEAVDLVEKVSAILEDVKLNGDIAVERYTTAFDSAANCPIAVTDEEIAAAVGSVSEDLKQAIGIAIDNIRKFHVGQLLQPEVIETMPGISCWRKTVAIEKVGLYIPGGSAPLFSTILMLGVPASIAGCREIVLCSPPSKDGTLNPAILYAAQAVGIRSIFKVGGVQAIGAMAYGTTTIPKVYKIFGPGNQYVTCAKQLVQQEGIAIDMPAGPSEVAVYGDETANAQFVASDLLSQAEHGPDSQVLLVGTASLDVPAIQAAIAAQLAALPRHAAAAKALEHSKLVIMSNEADAIDLLNAYAPEHLILACQNADDIAEKVVNAGSVFIGHYSPESVGDYASGTNHTLPTNGYARAYSGVSVDSFVKKITFQKLTAQGLKAIGSTVEILAHAEGLDAHRNAITLRLAAIAAAEGNA